MNYNIKVIRKSNKNNIFNRKLNPYIESLKLNLNPKTIRHINFQTSGFNLTEFPNKNTPEIRFSLDRNLQPHTKRCGFELEPYK